MLSPSTIALIRRSAAPDLITFHQDSIILKALLIEQCILFSSHNKYIVLHKIINGTQLAQQPP